MNKLDNTRKQLAMQVKCAKNAEIYHAMFLSFGSLLGYVREGTFISHDDDLDIGFHGDMIDKKQFELYLVLLNEMALEKTGRKPYRWLYTTNPHTGKHFWASVRVWHKDVCYKCCQWVFFEHKGYSWHHKGNDSLIKGIPAKYLELGEKVEFLGQEIRIPKYAGAALDFWYPDWATPRMGGKSNGMIMKVGKWKDKSTWKIQQEL